MDGGSSSKRTVEAPPEGESGAKRLNVSIGPDTLDCPICFEPLRPPIFQCPVGHFICSRCLGRQLDNKCHICSIKTSFERCFGMEHVVRSVTVPCSNAVYGCTEKVIYYEKEEHEKGCPNAPCFCPKSDCDFAGPTMALLDHFTTQHKCPLTTLPDSDRAASLRLQSGLHVLQCGTETGYFFLLSMTLEPFGHAISVVCVQPKATEPKFSCTMNYECIANGYSESTSCNIRSSSLSDGLPTGYDVILPKGKISDDRNIIMLRVTLHQPSRPRSFVRGNGPIPLQQSPCSETDDEDNIPLMRRSHLRGIGSAPARQQIPYVDTSDDDYSDEDDDNYYEDDDCDDSYNVADF
ncbi:unnamed protein product [Alopecurus aequalis]